VLAIVGYVVSVDSCLIGNAAESAFRHYPTLVLGALLQIAGVAIFVIQLIWSTMFRTIAARYLSSPTAKLFAFLGGVIATWMSFELMAFALYNEGINNKLDNAHTIDAAVRLCCTFGGH